MNHKYIHGITVAPIGKQITKDIKIILLNEIEVDGVDLFIRFIKEMFKEQIKYNLIDYPPHKAYKIHKKYNLKEQCIDIHWFDMGSWNLIIRSKELEELIDYHYTFSMYYYPSSDILKIKRFDYNTEECLGRNS